MKSIELQKLAKDHENADLADRLQKFVSVTEGQQPGGHTIMFRGKISELMTNARDAESRENWDLALEHYGDALRLVREFKIVLLICSAKWRDSVKEMEHRRSH